MRYAAVLMLALIIGSQADAQYIRRQARAYPSYNYSYSTYPSYSYYTTPGSVVTAGYYSPYAYSNNYVYPSSYYTPAWTGGYYNSGWNNNYYNSGWTNYGSRYNGGYRRGYRW